MTTVTLYRYSEGRGQWTLSVMSGRPPVRSADSGALGTQPEWLATVCALAKVGEHETVPLDPPPDRFFWFRLDESGELVGFHDIMKGT